MAYSLFGETSSSEQTIVTGQLVSLSPLDMVLEYKFFILSILIIFILYKYDKLPMFKKSAGFGRRR
jgi:hypothetical protein